MSVKLWTQSAERSGSNSIPGLLAQLIVWGRFYHGGYLPHHLHHAILEFKALNFAILHNPTMKVFIII